MAEITGIGNLQAEEVRFDDRHVLFVEGSGQDSIDSNALKVLLENKIAVKPLGASYHVESVAEALHAHHPRYYFLIDRDHHRNEDFVESSWIDFPDESKHNLIVWKKKEIENYFLDPDYLASSTYCSVDRDDLEAKILDISKARLYLDVANYVIVSIRESLKQNWIKTSANPDDFPNRDVALEKLTSKKEFHQYESDVSEKALPENIERMFDESLESMTGGNDDISIGVGNWMNMLNGKKVLSQVVNSCFTVTANNGLSLSGSEKLNEVIKDLMGKDSNLLPADFVELRQLIFQRLAK